MRKRISIDQFLDARPLLIADTHIEELDSGDMLISYEHRQGWWNRLFRFLMPVPAKSQVLLDKWGAMVIAEIRHNRTVREILLVLQEKMDSEKEELKIALVRFLAMLAKKGFVVFQPPDDFGGTS